jgi:hypothetical protein
MGGNLQLHLGHSQLGKKRTCTSVSNRDAEVQACSINREPAKKTSRRHFSSVDVAPRKRLRTFFYGIYPIENAVYTGVLQIFHTNNR